MGGPVAELRGAAGEEFHDSFAMEGSAPIPAEFVVFFVSAIDFDLDRHALEDLDVFSANRLAGGVEALGAEDAFRVGDGPFVEFVFRTLAGGTWAVWSPDEVRVD